MTSSLALLIALAALIAPGISRFADDLDAATVQASIARIETLDSVGTGFAVGPRTVLTAAHVVEGEDNPRVTIGDLALTGKVIRRDSAMDLAIISIDEDQPVLRFASNPPAVLDQVFAFGNPLGGRTAVSRGIVSDIDGVRIQTDAAVNPGNSGGPLVNDSGEVVGLVISKDREAEGVSYAVALNQLVKFVEINSPSASSGSAAPGSEIPPATAPSTTVPASMPGQQAPKAQNPQPRAVKDSSSSQVLVAVLGAVLVGGLFAALIVLVSKRSTRTKRIVIDSSDLPEVNTSAETSNPRGDRIVVGSTTLERTENHE
jgi:hypothetical protein